MWGDNPFARPISSFQKPVPLVTVDPDDEPDYQVCFRKEWLPYIIGSLQQLLLQTTWKTDDKDALNLVQARAQLLISMFLNACEGDMDVRQNEETPCILEKTNDGIEWVPFADLSLCPPAVLPTLTVPKSWRVVSGHTQVSVNGGTTFYEFPDGDAVLYGQRDPVFSTGVDKNCVAAYNIQAVLKSHIEDFKTQLQVTGAALTIFSAVMTIGLIVMTGGIAAPAALALASFLVDAGYAGVNAAFTNAVYDDFLCDIYTHMTDGVISGDQFSALIATWHSRGGTAWDLIETWANGWGPVGLNNMVNMAGITTCSSTPCEHGFVVPANVGDPGYDTGIDLTSGRAFSVSASGTWKISQSSPYNVNMGPDGVDVNLDGNGYVTRLPTATDGKLLYRIGTSGAWHACGSSLSTNAYQAGRLYFAMNDTTAYLGDNSGSVSVTVTM